MKTQYEVNRSNPLATRYNIQDLSGSAGANTIFGDQKYAGVVPNGAAAVGKPTALYELKDQNTLTMMLKVQRNW